MQPIRKNELEFHEKLIEKKASSQKNELDRKIRVEAEKLTEKSLVAFKKKIKADKLLEAYKNATKEYNAFIDQKNAREKQLERKKDEACEKLATHLETQAKIYDWNERRIEHNESSSHYEAIIRDACNKEAMSHVKKSDLGMKYMSLGIVEEQAKISLMSGSPLSEAVKNINSIMRQSGIVYYNYKIPQIASK